MSEKTMTLADLRFRCAICGYRYTGHDEAYPHWLDAHSPGPRVPKPSPDPSTPLVAGQEDDGQQ